MSNSLKRIILLVLVFIFMLSYAVFASKQNIKPIKVKFRDGTEITISSYEKDPYKILKSNNIVLLSNEDVKLYNYEEYNLINIIEKENASNTANEKKITVLNIKNMDIYENYKNIVEKIEVETIEIPFETITRAADGYTEENTTNRIVQIGQNGVKEIKYRSIYKNDQCINREKIEEKVIKEPISKIVQLSPKYTARSVNIPRGAAQEAFNKICDEKGLSARERDGWASIINRESTWNTIATNKSSGAYGLPQALPGSKMASHGSDWRTNPETQLRWMYDYMVSRYKSIDGALNFWNTHHWY